jgi:hypothetical protein
MAAGATYHRWNLALGIATSLAALFIAFAGWAHGYRLPCFSLMDLASWIVTAILILLIVIRPLAPDLDPMWTVSGIKRWRWLSGFGVLFLAPLILGHILAVPLYRVGRQAFLAEVAFPNLAAECRELSLAIEAGSHPKSDFIPSDAHHFPTIHRFHFSSIHYVHSTRCLILQYESGLIFDVLDQGRRIECLYNEDRNCWVLQIGNRDGWRELATASGSPPPPTIHSATIR